MLEAKKTTAAALSLALFASSLGPQAWLAVAAETTGRASIPVIEPLSVVSPVQASVVAPELGRLAVPDLALTAATLPAAEIPAAAAAVSAQAQIIRPGADAHSAQAARFAGDLARLRAPTSLSQLPAQAAGESSRGAASEDFAREIGDDERPRAGSAEVEAALAAGSAPALAAARSKGESRKAEPPVVRERRSPAMPAAIAGFFTAASAAVGAVTVFLSHSAPLISGAGAAHAGAAAVAAFTAAGVLASAAGLFGGLALLDVGFYAYAKSRGKGATAADLKAALQVDVLEGRLDPGVAELVKPDLSGRGLGLAYAVGGFVYLRPELAHTPFLRQMALIHELHHLRQTRARGPPKTGTLRALFSRARRDVAARVAEFGSAARLRDVKIPLLERVTRQTQNSLRLGRPIDVLVVNPESPEFKDASVYDALSDGNARVEIIESASPQDELGKPGRARRFGAVVLGRPFSLLPAQGSQDAQKLEATLKQLDGLYLLATRRAPSPQAFQGTEFEKKFLALSRRGARLDPRDKRAAEGFEKQIREFWQVIATNRLKGMALTSLVENLYGSLENKGMAFLSFGPADPGVVVWERLLRYWEAAEGGQFHVSRVDREDGSHVLVLRKAESRVGLWLRPTAGHAIKKSVGDAGATVQARQAARAALIEAGFEEHLKRFDELEIEIKDVFGEDEGRQEIYVTIPRRNAAQIKQFVARSAMDMDHSDGNFRPQLSDMANLHDIPAVWNLGVTGEDGTVMIIDTSADATHDDFKLADGRSVVEVLDIVHEGPEDWVGHGSHTSGIVGSLNKIYRGIARGVGIIMAKVFGKESPGASDGDIMGGATIGFQRGVDVISMSLGQRGTADSNLADFFSVLTRKKNGKGEYTIVVASAGNAGPFRESASQPAAGRFVRSVGAAVMAPDDKNWEIPFFSSVGFSLDLRYAIRRVYPFPHGLWKGGDVVTDPGDVNVYKRGVVSTKSKDMAPSLSDTKDRKHTGMSGTSMAAPGDAANQALIKKALKLAGLLEPGSFVAENLPLAADAIAMRSSKDLKLPLQRQGMGVGDGMAAMRLIFGDRVSALRLRAGRLPGLGWTLPKTSPSFLAWIERYKAVLDLEDKIYEGTEAAKAETPARFDDDGADDSQGETAGEQQAQAGDAAHQKALARFYEQRKAAVPELLKALKDDVWLVRWQAAFTLFNIMPPGRPKAANDDEAAAQAKNLAELRRAAALALTEAGFNDADPRVRQAAFLALGEIPGRTVDMALQKAAADKRWDVAVYGSYALTRHGDRSGVARLVKEATLVAEPKEGEYAPDKYARYCATALLGELGGNATVADAELLSAKVADSKERANIRHLAAASLFNIAGDAPAAISDRTIENLLNASGMDNLALTRTVYRFFPVAFKEKAILERLRQEPLRTTATVFVLKHKAAVEQPGALGDLVNLLARSLDIPLDLPTPVPDPTGRGVPGVDPALGAVDILFELPSKTPVQRYWDDSQPQAEAAALLGAELSAAIGRYEGVVKAVMPLSRAVWVSVPEHKIFAFSVAARKLGLEPRGARPLYTLAAQTDNELPQVRLDGSGTPTGQAQLDEAPLIRVTTKAGASEARALAALERLAAKRDALKKPLIVSIEVGAPAVLTDPSQASLLSRLADRLVLANIGVVASTGNEGPGEKTLAAPADAELPVVVAAAAKDSGLQFYSGRAGKDGRAATWTDLVDEIALDPDAPENAAIGTAVASRRTAEKLSAMAAKMAEKGPLPDGWFLYLTGLVRQTLDPIPGRSPVEVGGGLFADGAKALALLDERLKDPAKAGRDSIALNADARRRVEARIAPLAADGTLWAAVKSSRRVTQTSPGAALHNFDADFGASPRGSSSWGGWKKALAPVLLAAAPASTHAGLWWQDPAAVRPVESIPIYALRRAVDDPGIGKLTDLGRYYRDELAPQGVQAVHVMPHFAVKAESPYAAVSPFAVNEDFIDWSAVPEVAARPELLARLKAGGIAERQSVHYEAVRAREAEVAAAAYRTFLREELANQTPRAAAFRDFLTAQDAWLPDYAAFMTLSALIGKPAQEWTGQDQARAEADPRFGSLYALRVYSQWLAYEQLGQALKTIHDAGGRALFDVPMFRGKDGVDAWKHPQYFTDLKTRNPGVVNQWVHEDWKDLALWNWTALKRENYRPALAPFDHWLKFGFDGARADALHFAYNFGNGQLASGDEPGDDYVRALRAAFDATGGLPVAEAFEGKGGDAARLGFVTVKGDWRSVSGHDDPRGGGFLDRFLGSSRGAGSGRSSVFVAYTLGDEWGDPFPVKDVRDGRSYWRYRIPMADDPDFDHRVRDDRRAQLGAMAALSRGDVWARPDALWDAFKTAAGRFVKRVNGSVEIWAASMDWFLEEWGRDTFVSLPGLLLSTGRTAEARENLRRFARFEKDGLIPNRLPPGGAAEYNTVDGSLWFIQAVKKYVDATGDRAFAEEMLPALRSVLDHYASGTGYRRYGRDNKIFMDQDGLIVSPAQATWMDADPEGMDRPVTPRNGKAVEINALWYAGLRFVAQLSGDARYDALADKAKASFNEKFWFETDSNRRAWGGTGGALRDVVEGDPHGEAIRPNMLIAVSHGGDLLSPERQRAVVLAATRDLLTPFGPRTLSYRDGMYRERYETWKPPLEKDQAYHQGTVWPWLMGVFLDALGRVRREQGWDEARVQAEVRAVLTPLASFLVGGAEGSLPEVFDGGRPADSLKNFSLEDEKGLAAALTWGSMQYPGGTRSQAWSVAETIRLLQQSLK